MKRLNPYMLFGVIGAAAVLAGAAVLWSRAGAPWAAWLLAVNAAAFALYGYDKAGARAAWLRVPETILHLAALLGGTPAAWAAQRTFRHKTAKQPFKTVFWLIAAAQAALIAWLAWRWWIHP